MNIFRGSFGSVTLLSFVFALAAPALPMTKITGEHFEIYTTGSAANAQDAIAALEQAHDFFVERQLIKEDRSKPLRVVAFQSDAEYAAYRYHSNAFGHFFKGPNHMFIVLTDLLPEHREALLHEYTHAVVRQAGFTLPQWLNEGIADLYSSLLAANGQVIVGLPLKGRLQTLNSAGLLPVTQLLSSGTLAANGSRAAMLYAESWALTHMLCFHPEYAAGFERLLESATRTMDTPAVLEKVFGKNMAEIDRDLSDYVSKLPEAEGTSYGWSENVAALRTENVDEAQSSAVLTGLLTEQPWTSARLAAAQHQAE